MATGKPRVLFIYDHAKPELWKDGLWAALRLLQTKFDISEENLQIEHSKISSIPYDFILGWGAFGSPVDQEMRKPIYKHDKKGLCIAGVPLTTDSASYDVLFYETEWFGKKLVHPNKVHAFGVNTQIFNDNGMHFEYTPPIDYLTVGSYSLWKRQDKLIAKSGLRLSVGEIQGGNLSESLGIITKLLSGGVGVLDQQSPEALAKLYNISRTVYIPASVDGGGERAVLEARSCGCLVEVEDDNPKLQELLTSPIWDEHYYAKQLEKGIRSVL